MTITLGVHVYLSEVDGSLKKKTIKVESTLKTSAWAIIGFIYTVPYTIKYELMALYNNFH